MKTRGSRQCSNGRGTVKEEPDADIDDLGACPAPRKSSRPQRRRGVPVAHVTQQSSRSQRTIQRLLAVLSSKQQQAEQLQQQHEELCRTVDVLQQLVEFGSMAIEADVSPIAGLLDGPTTLTRGQQLLLVQLAELAGCSPQQQVLFDMLRHCSKSAAQALCTSEWCSVLRAAVFGGVQLVLGDVDAFEGEDFQKWADAMVALCRACLTWNADAFWHSYNINLDTLEPGMAPDGHWRQVVAQFAPSPQQVSMILGNQHYQRRSMGELTDRLHALAAARRCPEDVYTAYETAQELSDVLRQYSSMRLLFGTHFVGGLGNKEFARLWVLSWPYAMSVSGVGQAVAELHAPLGSQGSGSSDAGTLVDSLSTGLSELPINVGISSSWGGVQQQQQQLHQQQHAPLPLTLMGSSSQPRMQQQASLPSLLLQPLPATAILQELSGPAADELRRQARQEEQAQLQAWHMRLQQLASDYLCQLVGALQQRRELWSVMCPAQEVQTLQQQLSDMQQQQQQQQQQAQLMEGDQLFWPHSFGASYQQPAYQPPGLMLQAPAAVADTLQMPALQQVLESCREVLLAPQHAQLPGASEVVRQLEQQFMAALEEQQLMAAPVLTPDMFP